jgi:hypothetical protein
MAVVLLGAEGVAVWLILQGVAVAVASDLFPVKVVVAAVVP